MATYVKKTTTTPSVYYGKGQGIVITGESEVATFTAEGFGERGATGDIKWCPTNDMVVGTY